MATIKSNTDLKQSEKLAEILPIDSADNVIVKFGTREGTQTVVMPKETLDVIRTPFSDIREVTPCWSLSALLGLIPPGNILLRDALSGKYKCIDTIDSDYYDNPVDAAFEMVCLLKENESKL